MCIKGLVDNYFYYDIRDWKGNVTNLQTLTYQHKAPAASLDSQGAHVSCSAGAFEIVPCGFRWALTFANIA